MSESASRILSGIYQPELKIILWVGVHVAVELDAGVEPHCVQQVGLGAARRRV